MEDGFRLRLAIDDWYASRLSEGRRITVKMPSKEDALLFITDTKMIPPVVWVTLMRRIGRSLHATKQSLAVPDIL
jgi:hypothetical protein